MKPRIMWLDISQVWACFLSRDLDSDSVLEDDEYDDPPIGYGETPEKAFYDWVEVKKHEAQRNPS